MKALNLQPLPLADHLADLAVEALIDEADLHAGQEHRLPLLEAGPPRELAV